jgi:hypothetical protein
MSMCRELVGCVAGLNFLVGLNFIQGPRAMVHSHLITYSSLGLSVSAQPWCSFLVIHNIVTRRRCDGNCNSVLDSGCISRIEKGAVRCKGVV